MQLVIPRIALLIVLAGAAVFCYFESVYYGDHAIALGSQNSDLRLWMWVFRGIALASILFALLVTVDLVRKLLF